MPPSDATRANLTPDETLLYQHAEAVVHPEILYDLPLATRTRLAELTVESLEELARHRGAAADELEEPTSLDDVRAAIRAAMGELVDVRAVAELAGLGPLGRPQAPPPAMRMAALARAYRDLGGDLELPLTPPGPPAQAGRVETGLVDKVAAYAVEFVAELPGLENALSHADVLHGALERLTAAPTPAPSEAPA